MNKKIKSIIILFPVTVAITLYGSCNQLGLTKEKSDNTTLAAAAVLATRTTTTTSGSSCTSSTSTGSTITTSSATLDASSGCVSGVTTCMDSALPSWIKDNFKCAIGYVSGSNYIFKSKNIPNTKSYYFTAYSGQTPATTYPLYEALPSGN